jgi:2-polyprenyl-3-methyl-5-hydroxy-6-metoxy-1,4-benzoquinol methylase
MNKTLEQISGEYIDAVLPKEFSYERKKVLEDWVRKPKISEGIVYDFERRVGNLSGKKVLDIGFGNGLTLKEFAKQGAQMSGVEVTESLANIAKYILNESNISADLRMYDGFNFPFEDGTFDYIYSVSVFEHTDDPAQVLKEACRVLKPGGSFYLAFPNRLYPKETHTGTYFTSYLPRKIADRVLKMLGRSGMDIYWNLHFLSFFQLKKWLKKDGVSLSVRFETSTRSLPKRLFKKALATLGLHHSILLPHIMVILEKPQSIEN